MVGESSSFHIFMVTYMYCQSCYCVSLFLVWSHLFLVHHDIRCVELGLDVFPLLLIRVIFCSLLCMATEVAFSGLLYNKRESESFFYIRIPEIDNERFHNFVSGDFSFIGLLLQCFCILPCLIRNACHTFESQSLAINNFKRIVSLNKHMI